MQKNLSIKQFYHTYSSHQMIFFTFFYFCQIKYLTFVG